MSDWKDGDLADLEYTFGYYPELNPLRAKLALANAGLACPEIRTACELGFGQGLSVNVHAAASPVRWYGTDFNPSHAAFACEMAATSGAPVRLFDQSFAEFCGREDLPDFDFIALHGIWTWISADNQRWIVDFIRRKLKPGGVVCASYNVLPGWIGMTPIWHLLNRHAAIMAHPGCSLLSRLDTAIEFSEKVLENSPAFADEHPQLAEQLSKLKLQNRHYVAHEYFVENWRPLHFDQIAEAFQTAKLTYACPVELLEHIENLHFTDQQRAILRQIGDDPSRETVRDMMSNRRFRMDYWVKGARRLSPGEEIQRLRGCLLVLITPADDVTMKANARLGPVMLDEPTFRSVVEVLADHRPRTIGQIETALPDFSFAKLRESLLMLAGKGDVVMAQDDATADGLRPCTERLNRRLMETANSGDEIELLASPTVGGALALGRFYQMLLSARAGGARGPAEWAAVAWAVLEARGERISKDGTAMATPEDNLAHLTAMAGKLAGKMLPVLEALKVA